MNPNWAWKIKSKALIEWETPFEKSQFLPLTKTLLKIPTQSHLERMVKSTNQIDYDESNKVDNETKKVNKKMAIIGISS